MDDVERLKAVIEHLKLNPKRFSESLGFQRPDRIYQILNRRNKISSNLALEITTKYNIFNYSWLLTGEGEMLKTSTEVNEPQQKYTDNNTYDLIIKATTDTITALQNAGQIYPSGFVQELKNELTKCKEELSQCKEELIRLRTELTLKEDQPDNKSGQKRKAG